MTNAPPFNWLRSMTRPLGLTLAMAPCAAAAWAAPNPSVAYTYDALNRLTRVVYPSGASIDYVYDDMGNRTQLTAASVPDADGDGIPDMSCPTARAARCQRQQVWQDLAWPAPSWATRTASGCRRPRPWARRSPR